MAERIRFFGTIRFAAEAGLDPDELAGRVLRIEGRVSGGLGEEASFAAHEENVGLVEAYLVQAARLADDGVHLGEVCDLHSDQLEGVYAALFDEQDELREDLAIASDWDVLVHIGWVEVDPRYRRSGVVGLMIQAMIRHFCPIGLVTAYASVLDLAHDEWRSLGFRRIAGSEVVYRDNTADDPYGHPLDGRPD